MKFFRILSILFVLLTLYTMREDILLALKKIERGGNNLIHIIESKFNKDQNIISTSVASSALTNSVGEIKNSVKDIIKDFNNNPEPLKLIQKLHSFNNDEALVVSKIILATNNERNKNGLKSLKENQDLDNSAQFKTNDMIARQYFEHESPDGKGVSDLAILAGYDYIVIGENLAVGNFESSNAVVVAWMNSPGHRANILNTRYSDIGIGIGKGSYEGKKVWFAVQHFGLPRSACPVVDEALKNSVKDSQLIIYNIEIRLTELKGEISAPLANTKEDYINNLSEYNSLVKQYNDLVKKTATLVTTYNKEVKLFNNCSQGK